MPSIRFCTCCTFPTCICTICRVIFKACAEAQLIINPGDKALLNRPKSRSDREHWLCLEIPPYVFCPIWFSLKSARKTALLAQKMFFRNKRNCTIIFQSLVLCCLQACQCFLLLAQRVLGSSLGFQWVLGSSFFFLFNEGGDGEKYQCQSWLILNSTLHK